MIGVRINSYYLVESLEIEPDPLGMVHDMCRFAMVRGSNRFLNRNWSSTACALIISKIITRINIYVINKGIFQKSR